MDAALPILVLNIRIGGDDAPQILELAYSLQGLLTN